MNIKKNTEGYADPTAYSALRKEAERETDVNRLIHTLKYIISLSDYDLVERIVLRDKDGRVYR